MGIGKRFFAVGLFAVVQFGFSISGISASSNNNAVPPSKSAPVKVAPRPAAPAPAPSVAAHPSAPGFAQAPPKPAVLGPAPWQSNAVSTPPYVAPAQAPKQQSAMQPPVSPTYHPSPGQLAVGTVQGLPQAAAGAATGFVQGSANAVQGMATGAVQTVQHPVQTLQGIGSAAMHPAQTGSAIVGAGAQTIDQYRTAISQGNAQAAGQVVGKVFTNAATAVVGGSAVSAGRTAAEVSDAARLSAAGRDLSKVGSADTASALNRAELAKVGAPYGATPDGRPLTQHYGVETGPIRNIPGSVVDNTVRTSQGVYSPGGKTVYYDPKNNVTVITGDNGSIVSAHKGPP